MPEAKRHSSPQSLRRRLIQQPPEQRSARLPGPRATRPCPALRPRVPRLQALEQERPRAREPALPSWTQAREEEQLWAQTPERTRPRLQALAPRAQGQVQAAALEQERPRARKQALAPAAPAREPEPGQERARVQVGVKALRRPAREQAQVAALEPARVAILARAQVAAPGPVVALVQALRQSERHSLLCLLHSRPSLRRPRSDREGWCHSLG